MIRRTRGRRHIRIRRDPASDGRGEAGAWTARQALGYGDRAKQTPVGAKRLGLVICVDSWPVLTS